MPGSWTVQMPRGCLRLKYPDAILLPRQPSPSSVADPMSSAQPNWSTHEPEDFQPRRTIIDGRGRKEVFPMNVLHRSGLRFAAALLACSVPLALVSHAVESQDTSGA